MKSWKRILVLMTLTLSLVATLGLVSCVDNDDYEDQEEFATNATERETYIEEEDQGVQNAGADTDDQWGEIIRS